MMNEEKIKNKKGIYLLISIILGISIITIAASILLLNKSYRNNEFVCTWDCKGIGKTAKGDNYVFTFKFDNNMKFEYGPYAELDKESFNGTYKIKESNKKDKYTITFIYDNKKKDMDIGATIERNDNKLTAVFTDTDDASYICYLNSKKNPDLK